MALHISFEVYGVSHNWICYPLRSLGAVFKLNEGRKTLEAERDALKDASVHENTLRKRAEEEREAVSLITKVYLRYSCPFCLCQRDALMEKTL